MSAKKVLYLRKEIHGLWQQPCTRKDTRRMLRRLQFERGCSREIRAVSRTENRNNRKQITPLMSSRKITTKRAEGGGASGARPKPKGGAR